MAEIMLKIGDEAGFLDGDPIHAFNDRKILWTNANVICHHRRAGFNQHGLRPLASAAEEYAKLTSEYRFERVSTKEILRTRMATNEQDVFSDVPRIVDGRSQHIFVQEYVDYATKRATHRIFGLPGAEVWYGGSIRIDVGKVDQMWQMIETKTPKRKADHKLWPAGGLDLQHHFMFHVEDFDDAAADSLTEPEFGPVTKIRNGIPKTKRMAVKQRKNNSRWEESLGMSGPTVDDIKNKNKRVDRKPEIVHTLNKVFPAWRM